MLETLVNLGGLLIKFAEFLKDKNNDEEAKKAKKYKEFKEFFDNYLEPMYQEADRVYKDYFFLLSRVKKNLMDGLPLAEIIERLESGRLENMTLRGKNRAILTRKEQKIKQENKEQQREEFKENRGKVRAILEKKRVEISEFTRLERGVFGLIRGGLSRYESATDYDMTPYGHYSQHTLLDLLDRFKLADTEEGRKRILEAVETQLDCLQRAWGDVTAGYAEWYEKVTPPQPR